MKSQQTYGIIYPVPVRRSSGIPMPSSHIHRTESELQLHSDMEAAEWRDLQMFHRLVKGISMKQQQCLQNKWLRDDSHQTTDVILRNERSIKNIISTRQQHIIPACATEEDSISFSLDERSHHQEDSLSIISQSSFGVSHDMACSPFVEDDWSVSGYGSSDEDVSYQYASSSTISQVSESHQDNWSETDPVFEIEL